MPFLPIVDYFKEIHQLKIIILFLSYFQSKKHSTYFPLLAVFLIVQLMGDCRRNFHEIIIISLQALFFYISRD